MSSVKRQQFMREANEIRAALDLKHSSSNINVNNEADPPSVEKPKNLLILFLFIYYNKYE